MEAALMRLVLLRGDASRGASAGRRLLIESRPDTRVLITLPSGRLLLDEVAFLLVSEP